MRWDAPMIARPNSAGTSPRGLTLTEAGNAIIGTREDISRSHTASQSLLSRTRQRPAPSRWSMPPLCGARSRSRRVASHWSRKPVSNRECFQTTHRLAASWFGLTQRLCCGSLRSSFESRQRALSGVKLGKR